MLKWQRILVYPFYRKTEFAPFCFNDTKHIIWLYSYKNPFIIAEGHPCFPNIPILHMSKFQLQHSFYLLGFNPFHVIGLFLCPLRTSKNRGFLIEKERGMKWVNELIRTSPFRQLIKRQKWERTFPTPLYLLSQVPKILWNWILRWKEISVPTQVYCVMTMPSHKWKTARKMMMWWQWSRDNDGNDHNVKALP